MATPHPTTGLVGPDTLITVKVIIDGTNRRFKLALRDLSASSLPQKLRFLLAIPPDREVRFDRFSDSAGTYITLDSNNPAIYKQLYRAAKAKLKLRLRATVEGDSVKDEMPQATPVPANPLSAKDAAPAEAKDPVCAPATLPRAPDAVPSFTSFPKTCSYSSNCAVPGAFEVGGSVERLDAAIAEGKRTCIRTDAPAAGQDIFSLPTLPSLDDFPSAAYSIDCNNCGVSVPNEHYHCGVCEQGDFDLCQRCVESGVTCHGDEHWLLKRTIHNGVVIPSVTETLPPKKLAKAVTASSVDPFSPVSPDHDDGERTCNSCICQLAEENFVTCQNCPDFDLCLTCFLDNEHGHDPAHRFQAQDEMAYEKKSALKTLCAPGRGVTHHATCDMCDQGIHGVRHKCQSCPDFDLCSDCVAAAPETHPGHRFAALYTPLPVLLSRKPFHRGIYCDGPLCSTYKGYISGDRYKCSVCHDTDFCASCEALPNNGHNASHPLIKIKVPIRHVSITTHHQAEPGQMATQLGDRPPAKHASTETTRAASANAATQVQTVAEVTPTDSAASTTSADVLSGHPVLDELQAWFVSDSTPDGSHVAPNHLISQSWTLRNPGPTTWPAGCAVSFIGGDDMRNLDAVHPSSVSAMAVANRSNVLETSLEPGKTAVFTVLLKSPTREGRAISYWRLKTPEGLPFGHKLWVDIQVRTVELPIRATVVPAPAAAVVGVAEESPSSSTMIFPKLEKESPVASTHDVSEMAPPAVMEPIKPEEDIESLELEDSDSDEAGFMTDEEYDILDASDEELFTEAH